MSKEISWEEVEQHHGDADTVWTVIKGRVYDVTKFLDEHPGGGEIIKDNAGLDSTEQFEDVGHSSDAWEMLKDYEIGTVEGEEAEAMVEVITMMMTDILTDKVIVTEAEVCMTPWSASRGPTTRLTRT